MGHVIFQLKEGQVTPFCLEPNEIIQDFIEILPRSSSEKKRKRRRSILKGGSLSGLSNRRLKSTSLSALFDHEIKSSSSASSVVQIRERTQTASEPLQTSTVEKKPRKAFFKASPHKSSETSSEKEQEKKKRKSRNSKKSLEKT